MLTGTILGLIIAALTAYALVLKGQNSAYAGQITRLAKEQAAAEIAIGRFVSLEQDRQRLKENITIHFTEEQITALANRLSARVQTIINSVNSNALSKLD